MAKITIHDHWGGLNPAAPFDATWTIAPEQGAYHLRGEAWVFDEEARSKGKWRKKHVGPIDVTLRNEAVDALVAALRAPPAQTVDAKALGVEPSGALAYIDEQAGTLLALARDPALQARIRAWQTQARQPDAIAAALARGLAESSHSDDYPSMHVELTSSDGALITMYSRSQNTMMLPWTDGDHALNFSVALSHALAAVVPADSPNAGRLQGTVSPEVTGDLLGSGTAAEISRFKAEAVAPAAVAALTGRFNVDEIYVYDPDKTSATLRASLGYAGMPANAHVEMNITLKDGDVPPAVLTEAERQWSLVAGAPAMVRAFKAAPHDKFIIDLIDRKDVHDDLFAVDIFSSDVRRLFIEQMHARHQLLDVATNSPLLAHAIEVKQGFAPVSWVVLPDHRVIRWQAFTMGGHTDGTPCTAEMDVATHHPTSRQATCYGDVYNAEGDP